MKRSAILGAICRHGLARSLLPVAAVASCLFMTALPADAQTDEDLPARVARVAEFAGDIFLATEDRATEWTPVGLNYPVTSGDNLWVGGVGRAEVDFGGGQFRMGGDTNLNVSRLDDRQLVLFVAQGRLVVRVRVLGSGEAARIDTPNAQVRLMRPGLYRIDVPPDRATTTVSVREGEAQIAFVGGLQQTLPGQSVILVGPEPAFADLRNSMPRDALDAWSANRDRYYEIGPVAGYVSPEMVGYADLDHYGAWESYPDYGNVWFPTEVAPDWAPYSDGYWTSVGGWGNTWVDAAPWGYAPSHYGRWARFGGRWGWCPGRVPVHPAWAPAMVAWYGGAGWGSSLGNRGPVYGWVPLGWREPFQPWWHGCDERCWTRYNRPYSVAVPYAQRRSGSQNYVNASVPGALSAVAGATLAERKPVAPNRIVLPTRAAELAPVLADAPPVRTAPTAMAARPTAPALPLPASTLRPTLSSDRIHAAPGVLPTRAQPPAATSATPAETPVRIPASVGRAPVTTIPATPAAGSPANPARASIYAVPAAPSSRDAGASAPPASADGRASVRSDSPRSVPVPASSAPSSNAGIVMPAPRFEPSRSVPAPQSVPMPAAGVPMPVARPVANQPLPSRPDAPPAVAAPQAPVPQAQAPGQVAPAAPAEGRAAPSAHPKDARDAPAPATTATPAVPSK